MTAPTPSGAFLCVLAIHGTVEDGKLACVGRGSCIGSQKNLFVAFFGSMVKLSTWAKIAWPDGIIAKELITRT
jgi:hypothetical protein